MFKGQANILADGNMETAGIGDWGSLISAVLSKQTSSPHSGTNWLKVLNVGGGNGASYQEIMIIGKTYRVTGWARGDGGNGIPNIFQGSLRWIGTNSSDWQWFDETFTASSNDRLYFQIAHDGIGVYVGWDDIRVEEVL